MPRSKMRTRVLATAMALLAVGSAPMLCVAAPAARAAQTHATAPAPTEVHEFTLSNGLRVVVMPQPGTALVSHTLWYDVGSIDDPVGKSGLAHFLEHMMFQGTATYKPGEFFRTISAMGGEKNAFTSHDVTAYYVLIARTHLPKIMAMEADRMLNMAPPTAAFVKEREVIMEERRQRVDMDPSGRMQEELDAALYVQHPYGRPVIGWAKEMEQLNRADVLAFHKAHYAPNNATLVLAGDITLADAKQLVKTYYGALARRPIAPRMAVHEPAARGDINMRYTDALVQQPMYQVSWQVPSLGREGSRAAATQFVLASILGENQSSRMFQSVVMDQQIATQAGMSYMGMRRGPGRMIAYAVPTQSLMKDHPNDWQTRIETALHTTLKQLADAPPSETEMQRARMQLRAAAIYGMDSVQGSAQLLGQLRMLGLPANYLQQWPKDIAAVTAADVQAAAKTLVASRSVGGWLLPEGAPKAVEGVPAEATHSPRRRR